MFRQPAMEQTNVAVAERIARDHHWVIKYLDDTVMFARDETIIWAMFGAKGQITRLATSFDGRATVHVTARKFDTLIGLFAGSVVAGTHAN